VDQPSQFDYYDGGGLDVAVLGAVEVDPQGSVNVSSFAGRFAGVGGFVNITQNAKRVIFCCTFRAGDIEVDVQDGALRIVREGKHAKFVKRVGMVCFHGPSAIARGQRVTFITERAVFELRADGLALTEIATGIDVRSQVLDLMEFAPTNIQAAMMPKECFAK